jgi:Carboxypeptidase regulatory-like domain
LLSGDNVDMTASLKKAALTSGVLFVVGNVPVNELTGSVRDVCGPVLPGTSVSVANQAGTAARVAADGEGRYSLKSLAPGRWAITFAMSGYQTLQQDIRLLNGEPVQLNVRLLPDLLLKQELVVTHGDPTVRYRRYSVHGIVAARSGEPVSAATVRLRDAGSGRSRGLADPCTTDELGRYVISEWSPSETRWRLSVEAEGFRSYTHPDFELAPDEPRAIDLRLERR